MNNWNIFNDKWELIKLEIENYIRGGKLIKNYQNYTLFNLILNQNCIIV